VPSSRSSISIFDVGKRCVLIAAFLGGTGILMVHYGDPLARSALDLASPCAGGRRRWTWIWTWVHRTPTGPASVAAPCGRGTLGVSMALFCAAIVGPGTVGDLH